MDMINNCCYKWIFIMAIVGVLFGIYICAPTPIG